MGGWRSNFFPWTVDRSTGTVDHIYYQIIGFIEYLSTTLLLLLMIIFVLRKNYTTKSQSQPVSQSDRGRKVDQVVDVFLVEENTFPIFQYN